MWRRTSPTSAISDCGCYRVTRVTHGHRSPGDEVRYEAWRVGFPNRPASMLDHYATKTEAIAACVADAEREAA